MAGSSLLVLIDDIATVLDDVALMTKTATKKTAGVLGDDLALNAQQVTGVKPARELPVVWAVAKGSMINKAILVPAALAISFFMPWLVTPLLMLGGAFLCFEGFEKLVHTFLHREEDQKRKGQLREALKNPETDLRAIEKDKIKGAIRTDFILSAEIIAITLGTVTTQTIGMQFMVLAVVAIMITVFVYGLVAGIVKLDDGGLYLSQQDNPVLQKLGSAILWLATSLLKLLFIFACLAMFLLGGGILTHGFTPVHDPIHNYSVGFSAVVRAFVRSIVNGHYGGVASGSCIDLTLPTT